MGEVVTNIFTKRTVNHTPHSFPKTPEEIESLSRTFKGTYIQTRDHWKYTARISDLLEMIRYTYGISEWELVELRELNNGPMQSEWINHLIDYREGKQVDFGEIWEEIKKQVNFSIRELNLIETGEIDVRLWAIFTVLVDQTLPITY